MELDSHADSHVVGSEALIIRTHDRKVRVNGFTPALGSKTVDVVDAAVAYECEFTGKVLIMVIRLCFISLRCSPFLITIISTFPVNSHSQVIRVTRS